jgi:hypothetical protein
MALCRATDATPDRVTVQSGRVTPVRRKTETRRQQRIALFRKADRPTVLATQRRRPGQSHLGKADSSGSWTRVEAFPISASALRLPVLFGLERAAQALGHHANLDTSYGLFLPSGFSISRGSGWLSSWSEASGPAVVLTVGPPRQIVVRLEQYPCSTAKPYQSGTRPRVGECQSWELCRPEPVGAQNLEMLLGAPSTYAAYVGPPEESPTLSGPVGDEQARKRTGPAGHVSAGTLSHLDADQLP